MDEEETEHLTVVDGEKEGDNLPSDVTENLFVTSDGGDANVMEEAEGEEEKKPARCLEFLPTVYEFLIILIVVLLMLLLLLPVTFIYGGNLVRNWGTKDVVFGFEQVASLDFPSARMCMYNPGVPLYIPYEDAYCQYTQGIYAEEQDCSPKLTCEYDYEDEDEEVDQDEIYCCYFDNSVGSPLTAKNVSFSVTLYLKTNETYLKNKEEAVGGALITFKNSNAKEYSEIINFMAGAGDMTKGTIQVSKREYGIPAMNFPGTDVVVIPAQNLSSVLTYSAKPSSAPFFGGRTAGSNDSSLLIVQFSFSTMIVKKLSDVEKYSLLSFLGDWGGVTGIITGWSIFDLLLIAYAWVIPPLLHLLQVLTTATIREVREHMEEIHHAQAEAEKHSPPIAEEDTGKEKEESEEKEEEKEEKEELNGDETVSITVN